MIKTRLYVETPHAELTKTLMMPYRLNEGDIISLTAADDGEYELDVVSKGYYDLRTEVLCITLNLPRWTYEKGADVSMIEDDFIGQGWQTVQQEFAAFQATHASKSA